MVLALDHLVLAARTLREGVDWCEATIGIRPEAGGRHASMGTHNRVFAIGSPDFRRAYFEIIAIDPRAARPPRARWFDLDDRTLQHALATNGPQLVHWVARCDDLAATNAALLAAGVDCGEINAAERMTPQGLLRWRISVRADGRRALAGAAPALIEWGDVHPTDSMSDSGVELQAMQVAGWPASLRHLLPAGIDGETRRDSAPLFAQLTSPRGPVTLAAPRSTA